MAEINGFEQNREAAGGESLAAEASPEVIDAGSEEERGLPEGLAEAIEGITPPEGSSQESVSFFARAKNQLLNAATRLLEVAGAIGLTAGAGSALDFQTNLNINVTGIQEMAVTLINATNATSNLSPETLSSIMNLVPDAVHVGTSLVVGAG